jgi:hypothetical protein
MASVLIEQPINWQHSFLQLIHVTPNQSYRVTGKVKPIGTRNADMIVWDGQSGQAAVAAVLVDPPTLISSGTNSRGGIFLLDHSVQGPDPAGFFLFDFTVVANASPVLVIGGHALLDDQTNYIGDPAAGLTVKEMSCVQVPLPPPVSIYVALSGDDANPGTQLAPWKTLAKVNSAMPLSAGSQVLFNGGDTFVGNLTPIVAGGDANNRVVIGKYGTGRPTFVYGNTTLAYGSGGQSSAVINVESQTGLTIQDLIIRGGDLAHMPIAGIRIGNGGAGKTGWTKIQRCDIGNIMYFEATQFGNPSTQGSNGFHIFLQGYPGGGLDGLEIFDCELHGLSGPTSHDDVGIGGFGGGNNITAHIKNVKVYDIGGGPPGLTPGTAYPPMGDGIDLDGHINSLCEFCTAHDLGANYRNQGGGPAGFLTAKCVNTKFLRCLAYNVAPSDFALTQVDFIGFDIDIESNFCTIESCYAHDCYNSGFIFFNNGNVNWHDNTMINNISENNCRGGLFGFGEISLGLPGPYNPTVTVQNNTTFNNRVYSGAPFTTPNQGSAGFSMTGEGTFKGIVSRNINVTNIDIYGQSTPLNARSNNPWTADITIQDNAWWQQSGAFAIWWSTTQYFVLANWQAASGKGANIQLANPGFAALGSGPAGYVQSTYPGWGATPQASYGAP